LYSSRDTDWDKLDKKAKQLGWEELLRISFLACHRLFDTPIPAHLRQGDLPSWIKLFPESASPSWRDAFFATRLMSSRSDKARYIVRVLFVPTLAEYRLWRLPSFLGLLYYAFRPLRLVCKWVLGFLTGLCSRFFKHERLRVRCEGDEPKVGGQLSASDLRG
jgi:hypothetical protein